MELINNQITLALSDDFFSIVSYKINGAEFCAPGGEKRPLFTIKLLDENGKETRVNAFDAEAVKKDGDRIEFVNLKNMNITVHVTVKKHEDSGFSWHISADNGSDLYMEWIEFPQIVMAGALKGDGGDFELFWPAMEGQVIETTELRKKVWSYNEIGGQTAGYCGFYPGSCPMQFMAYYNNDNGFYIAAHDAARTPKTVEFYEDENGIVLEYRVFCGGAKGKYDCGYDMVTSSFSGDWYDAADIYRSWMEKNTQLPKKLYENERIPEWMASSPIVMLYPIRGTIDHGDMTPNMYYPYKNVLPIADELSKKTESRIMALPMHWEGTAPWATPYVWPPFGGEEEFTDFIDGLHKQGNLAGVYCSGIGWTTKSFLNPKLNFSDKYDEKLICRTPAGTIEQSKVIGEPIRLGYDMCPENEKVAELVANEVVSIAKSGCDYAQYFDQNLGGESSFCYAKDHGHPPAPGVWQNDAMIRIFKKVYSELDKIGSKMIIGCEGAASEPFIGYLPFNDLRYNIGIFLGKPVPAYGYLFHEYINNFMGNQNTIDWALDLGNNPDCLLYRIAYSLAAGDMLTVCLGRDGKIIWGWDTPWDVEAPKQEPIIRLMRNINMWRREYKEYLRFGRMIKPMPIEAEGKYEMNLKCGYTTVYPSLITTRWKSRTGEERQIIINFLDKEQSCKISAEKVYANPADSGEKADKTIKIPPLSAVWTN